MRVRAVLANALVPLGLAGIFRLLGLPLSAVVALFAPYWTALLMKQLDRWLYRILPRSEGGFLTTRSHPVCLLGFMLWFGAVQARLDKAAFSFLLGVAFIDLWPLLALLLFGTVSVLTRALRNFKPGEGFSLVFLLMPLVVDLTVYALWLPPARVLTLPLAAGAVLAALVTFFTMAVQGERIVEPPR